MAYRYEKNGDLVIDGWDGIGSTPYSGMGQMLGVNLETSGEVSVGYPITTSTVSGATLGNPIADSTRFFTYGTPAIPSGSPQSFAILDANGRVWETTSITGTWTFLSSGNSTTGSSSNDGLMYWLGYLFKTRGANIDYWDGSTWHTGWASTLTANFKHYMYVASDNVLYITNGNYVALVLAVPPDNFDPTNTGTFTVNPSKLRIPVTDEAISLAEVGGGNAQQSTLLIGGIFNAIYPWDKNASSFGLPIYVADSYIGLMVSANQNAFIFPGNQNGRGRIYVTNGSQASEFYKIPDYIFGEQEPYFVWGDAIFHRNRLLFGFFPTKNSGSGIIQNFGYVWALDLTAPTFAGGNAGEKTFRAISQIPTSVTFAANATCLISTLNLSSSGFGYILGWNNNSTTPGIGYSGTTAGFGTASILTDLIPVGTFLDKKTYKQIQYKLRTPLQSGESLQISPVVDGVTQSPLTFSPTPTTGSISGTAPVDFEKAQWLQFNVSLTGNSATSGVRFKEIRLTK